MALKELYETNIDLTEMKDDVNKINKYSSNDFFQLIGYITLIPKALIYDIKDRIE